MTLPVCSAPSNATALTNCPVSTVSEGYQSVMDVVHLGYVPWCIRSMCGHNTGCLAVWDSVKLPLAVFFYSAYKPCAFTRLELVTQLVHQGRLQVLPLTPQPTTCTCIQHDVEL